MKKDEAGLQTKDQVGNKKDNSPTHYLKKLDGEGEASGCENRENVTLKAGPINQSNDADFHRQPFLRLNMNAACRQFTTSSVERVQTCKYEFTGICLEAGLHHLFISAGSLQLRSYKQKKDRRSPTESFLK